MGFVRGLVKLAAGAGAGVAVITALPVFGAVGVVTAAGLVVGSLLGAAAGAADEVFESRKDGTRVQRVPSTARKSSKSS